MNTTVSIDKAGRIVLPKAVRDELQLTPGSSLELELSEDRISLRPERKGRMYKKDGIWVFHTGSPMPANLIQETIKKVRKEREDHILGKKR